jgi:tRNA A37 threonylcarbamoyladenosine dehydratase
MDTRFEREALLIGEASVEKLNKARVCLFGVGGVGSYAAEALARCGVGTIDIVDNDTVSVSNINRQLCALESTVGKYKIDVVAERLADINPAITVNKRYDFVLPETIDSFDLSLYDYVIDAIDSVSGKIEIVLRAKAANVPVISCMGAGNKLDPTAFTVTDLSKTSVCPLARVMRRELKKRGVEHLTVVYSIEPALSPQTAEEPEGKRPTPGSTAFVPAVCGLIAAGEVIKALAQAKNN